MKKLIEHELLSFGFLPLLLVIELLISKEKYEICSIISEVLNEQSNKYNLKFPTKYNEEAIEEMKYCFMKHHNLSGDITEKNHIIYAKEILNKIENYENI
jgi:hypothetical protein